MAVLMVVMIAAVAGASFFQLSSAVTRRQSQANDQRLAFYMAEAGINEAFAGLQLGRTGNVGSGVNPVAYGNGLFWVEAESLDEKRVELTSTGMVGTGRATLSLTAERGRQTLAALGFFSGRDLEIPEGVRIVAFDSATEGAVEDEAVDGTGAPRARIGSNGEIEVEADRRRPTYLDADLTHGPGERAKIDEHAVVTGAVEAATELVEFPEIELPPLETSSSLHVRRNDTQVVQPGRVGYRRIAADRGSELVLQGPLVLLVDRLDVRRNAELVFDTTEGPIELYVTRSLRLDRRAAVTCTVDDPLLVSLQYAGEGQVRLESRGDFYGFAYAPYGTLAIGRDFQVFGSVAAEKLRLQSGARLHFDQALVEWSEEAQIPTFLTWRILDISSASDGLQGTDPFRALGLSRAGLLTPAEGHADVWYDDLEYLDLARTGSRYVGWGRDFDWRSVSEIKRMTTYDRPGGAKLGKVVLKVDG